MRRYFGPIYLLACQIVVRSGATLSIQAGVTIYATPEDTAGNAPAIIVEKGGFIVADGTAAAPITFTALNADRTYAPHRFDRAPYGIQAAFVLHTLHSSPRS